MTKATRTDGMLEAGGQPYLGMGGAGTSAPMPHQFTHDIRGNVYGHLRVVEFSTRTHCQTMWLCQCDCGERRIVDGSSLKRGFTKSCGCLRRERARGLNRTHGQSGALATDEYRTYAGMKGRCRDPSNLSYPRYGGRGISVCDRWLNGEGGESGFECFLSDMGRRPSSKHSIERKRFNEGYEPSNCIWATAKDQIRNRSNTLVVEWRGRCISLAEVCELTGTPYKFAVHRFHHPEWSIERIVGRAALMKALRR